MLSDIGHPFRRVFFGTAGTGETRYRMSDQTKDDFAALFDEAFMQKMVSWRFILAPPVRSKSHRLFSTAVEEVEDQKS